MEARMIVKIIMLCLMLVCVIIAIASKFVIAGRSSGKDVYYMRKVMRIRLICFVAMLVFLLICFFI